MFSAFKKFGRMGGGSSIPWTPTKLFSAGEAGGLWDFSTLANLYQDSAGTTPCTAVGDPIGLVLDTKNGTPQLGPELVTNGDFSDGTTGWTLSAYTTAGTPSGGRVRFSGVAPGTNFNYIAYQILSVTAGKTYKISFPLTVVTGEIVVGLYTTGISTGYIGEIAGSQTVYVVATTATLSLTLFTWNGASTDVPFDVTVGPATVKAVPGNHLTQSTSTKRPVLGRMPATGVRNLLTYTEDFSNAVWAKSVGSVAGTGLPDGIGGNAGTLITFSGEGGYGIRLNNLASPLATATEFSLFLKYVDWRWFEVTTVKGSAVRSWVDLQNGVAGGTVGHAGFTVSPAQNGWVRVSCNMVAAVEEIYITPRDSNGSAAGATGNTGKSFKIFGAQAEPGLTATTYQRVGAAYDVTESGVASVYTAYFDGVDDVLTTGSVNLSAVDKVTVWGGFKYTSTGTYKIVIGQGELNTEPSFGIGAPFNNSSETCGYTRGVITRGESKSTDVTVNNPQVVTVAVNNAAPSGVDAVTMRQNGNAISGNLNNIGASNFQNDVIYVGDGKSGGLQYKGFLSALCTRGAATDATTVTSMEQWLAARTPGVTLP